MTSICPITPVPPMVGGAVFDGGTATTTAVTPVVAAAVPKLLEAVTRPFNVRPTSAAPRTRLALVEPAMSAQEPPFAPHHCHWYEYASGGVPAQLPFDIVNTCPATAVPAIVGGLTDEGGEPACAGAGVARTDSARSGSTIRARRPRSPVCALTGGQQ